MFIDKEYNWKDTTLLEFLNEGNIPSGWEDFFNQKEVKQELETISKYLSERGKKKPIYPWVNNIFRAFYCCNPNTIKAVFLGQDCYHNPDPKDPLKPGSATGLCFDVKPGGQINPSLRNIYDELEFENYKIKRDGRMEKWSKDIFLLNVGLTVEKSDPESHLDIWDKFTRLAIQYVAKNVSNVVWFLLGREAHFYKKYLDESNNCIITTSHPSPLGYKKEGRDYCAFFQSNIFRECNEYLDRIGKKIIDWEKK